MYAVHALMHAFSATVAVKIEVTALQRLHKQQQQKRHQPWKMQWKHKQHWHIRSIG